MNFPKSRSVFAQVTRMVRVKHQPAAYPHGSLTGLVLSEGCYRPLRVGCADSGRCLDHNCIRLSLSSLSNDWDMPINFRGFGPATIRGFFSLYLDRRYVPNNEI